MTITPLYSTKATATGGRDGKVIAANGDLELALAMPKELGGNGQGHNPEQLFAAGYASCFSSALGLVASKTEGVGKLPEGTQVAATVGIGKTEVGGFGLTVALEVKAPGLPTEVVEKLTHAAHQVCPYSNAVRGNVDVTLSVG